MCVLVGLTQCCRYQGRLAWKGTANIRNPAIAIALEMLLGAYRKPRPPVEPAPAMPGVVGTDPLVLPVRVSTHIPNPGSGAYGSRTERWLVCLLL